MKYRLLSLLLLCAILLGSAACSLLDQDDSSSSSTSQSSEVDPGPPADFPVTVRDVTLDKAPARIVSLSPMLTEMIYDLGAQEMLVAVSDYCAYPLDVASLPRAGVPSAPLVDEIVTLAPDLVVTLTPLQESVSATLDSHGIAVLVLTQAGDLSELTALYVEMGRALYGVNDVKGDMKGQELRAAIEKIGTRVQSYLSSIAKSPFSALYITSSDPHYATADSFEGKLLTAIGFSNAAGDATGYVLNDDAVKASNAQVIIDGGGLGLDAISADDRYKNLLAVTTKKVYEIDQGAMDCHGMRLPVLLEALAREAYPDAFGS